MTFNDFFIIPVMVHMTCKRTKTAKEDLEYVVKKFLRAGALEPNVSRSPTDSHTQTVSPDKRHLPVFLKSRFIKLYLSLLC